MHISSIWRTALVACVIAVAVGPAQAATVPADLRVEVPGVGDLSHGWTYYSDTATIDSDPSAPCNGKGQSHTVQGATALGILDYAQRHNRRLQPLRVSDEFDFGLLVCGIGQFVSSDNRFWLYKVNHVAPEVGADQYALKPGDDVLWVLSDFGTGELSGNELELVAPTDVQPNVPFEVTVNQYDFAGAKSPAAGAEIRGGAQGVTDANGKATLVIGDENPSEVIRAFRGNDIPSNAARVCAGNCERVWRTRLFGTDARDVIDATGAYASFVRARGGDDVIDVSGDGFIDRVGCGGGRDRVTADGEDRVHRDCEAVRRK